MRKNNEVCPVCEHEANHVSKDGGDTWQCGMCLGYHDMEARVRGEFVNIEVYPDGPEGENDVFAVLSEHKPEIPHGFDAMLQQWASEKFDPEDVEGGVENAGVMEYRPHEEIIGFGVK